MTTTQSSWESMKTGETLEEGATVVLVLKGKGTDRGMCSTLFEKSSFLNVR